MEIYADHFKPGTPDECWIPKVAQRGWIILTKDHRLRHRRPVLKVMKGTEARVIVLKKSADLSGDEMAAIYMKALPAIYRAAKRVEPPFIAKVGKDGKVVKWWPEPAKQPRRRLPSS